MLASVARFLLLQTGTVLLLSGLLLGACKTRPAINGAVAPATSEDLATSDSAQSDLAQSHQTRLIFLLPSRIGGYMYNGVAALDDECTAEATAHGMSGSFSVLVSATAAASGNVRGVLLPLAQRRVIQPDGTQVATDETFFGAHDVAIDQLADGSHALAGACVWTGFSASGDLTGQACQNYLGEAAGVAGSVSPGTSWATANPQEYCGHKCYLYCVQQ